MTTIGGRFLRNTSDDKDKRAGHMLKRHTQCGMKGMEIEKGMVDTRCRIKRFI